MTDRRNKMMGAVILIVGVFLFCGEWLAKYYYAHNRPTIADYDRGFTFLVNATYIRPIFVTENERTLLLSFPWVACVYFVSVLVWATIEVRSSKSRSRRP